MTVVRCLYRVAQKCLTEKTFFEDWHDIFPKMLRRPADDCTTVLEHFTAIVYATLLDIFEPPAYCGHRLGLL